MYSEIVSFALVLGDREKKTGQKAATNRFCLWIAGFHRDVHSIAQLSQLLPDFDGVHQIAIIDEILETPTLRVLPHKT